MFETFPFFGKVTRARKRYENKCLYIDEMAELPVDERAYLKEMARHELMMATTRYASGSHEKQ